MKRFIEALNSINPQVWAFLILLTGCASVLVFHRNGIDIGIAAGIIGAGVQMFTTNSKASGPGSQHVELDAVAPSPLVQPAIQPK